MKTTIKIATWSLVALLAAGFSSCKNEPEFTNPYMKFTTAKAVGESIEIWIDANEEYQSAIWIDLNNDGKRDDNESVTKYHVFVNYPIASKTITIYGKIKLLRCSNNQLQTLDISNNPSLKWLDCTNNQLTVLDLSKNKEMMGVYCSRNRITSLDVSRHKMLQTLECYKNELSALDVSNNKDLLSLSCYRNKISGAKMDVLVNSLPVCPKDYKGYFYVIDAESGDGNKITKAQVKIATDKNWNVMNSNQDPYSGE